MGGSFIFFFFKLNNEVTIIFLGGKKYTCIEEFFHPFFLNNENTRLPLDFKKIRLQVGVFSLF
jgi:hypothetical protein